MLYSKQQQASMLTNCLFSNNMMNKFHTSAVMLGQAKKKKRPVRFLLKTAKYLRPKMKDYDIAPTKKSFDRQVAAMDDVGSMAADPIDNFLFPVKMQQAQQQGSLQAELVEMFGSEKPDLSQMRRKPAMSNPFIAFMVENKDNDLTNVDWNDVRDRFTSTDIIEACLSLEEADREDLWKRICFEVYPMIQSLTVLDNYVPEIDGGLTDAEEAKAEEMFAKELWSLFQTKSDQFKVQLDKDLKNLGYEDMPEEEAQKLLPEDLKQELEELERMVKGDVLSREELRKARYTMEEMLEESFITNDSEYQHAKKMADKWKANFVSHEQGDKMWQLHKENPDYWTGERLGRAFGVPRNAAWAQVLMREAAEAKETGKPFNSQKINAIYAKEIDKLPFNLDGSPKKGSKKPLNVDKLDKKLTQGKTEEEVYAEFLKKSVEQKDDSDDALPSWAKYPFQEASKPNIAKKDQPTIQQLPIIPNVSTLGSNYSRYGVMFAEMTSNKKQAPLDRQFLVKETDDTLRTMTTTEKEFMTRRGHVKRTKWGMGQKEFRIRKARERRFDQIQS